MEFSRKAPTLLNLCIRSAIDNIRYLGNVGGIELDLLSQILPHCTMDQLAYIENCTPEMDLSQVTDDLWKQFYSAQFGTDNVNKVVRRMNESGVYFKWKQLYEAKKKERKAAEDRIADKLKRMYEEERAQKQRKQVKVCSKVPPSNKRSFGGFGGGGCSSSSNYKNNMLKKARIESNSYAKLQAAARRQNTTQEKKNTPSVRATQPMESRIIPPRITSRTDSPIKSMDSRITSRTGSPTVFEQQMNLTSTRFKFEQQTSTEKPNNVRRTGSPVCSKQELSTVRPGNVCGTDSPVSSRQQIKTVMGDNVCRTDSPLRLRQQINTARRSDSCRTESVVGSKHHMKEPKPMSELIQHAKKCFQNGRTKS